MVGESGQILRLPVKVSLSFLKNRQTSFLLVDTYYRRQGEFSWGLESTRDLTQL